jgi:hypothetical protein
MVFFFEFGVFALAMATLAVAEFLSRGAALAIWGGITALSLVTYLAYRGRAPRDSSGMPRGDVDARFWATLLYSWRRTNVILVIGTLVVAAAWAVGR